MRFKIDHICIENFRAIESLETDLWDRTCLAGDNETSKTGFATAILWALTGKSVDGDSTFEIVPAGKYGKVSPTVTIECTVDGKPLTLKREYKAKYARDKTFKDYATVCYINGLETGAKKFQEYISQHICNEQVFKILSNPYTFVENCPREQKELPWQAQRRFLMELVDTLTDEELLSDQEQWECLREPLQRYDSAQQYLAYLKQEYSKLQKQVGEFEARMAQQLENIAEVPMTRDEAIQKMEKCNQRREEIQLMKNAQLESESDQKAAEIKEEISSLQNEFEAVQREYSEELGKFTQEKSALEIKARAAKAKADEWITKQAEYASAVERLKKTTIKTVCETCGQRLTIQTIETSKRNIVDRVRKGLAYVEAARVRAQKCTEEYESIMAEANALNAPVYPVQELDILRKAVEDAVEELHSLNASKTSSQVPESLIEEEQKIEKEIESLKVVLYTISANEACREKAKLLEEEHHANNVALNEMQMQMDACKDFISYKCGKAEDQINALFPTVKFKLFEKNKSNEDIREVCDLTFNGHKYEDLSASTKLVASLELVSAFQKHYGVLVPIICDNMESVTADVVTDAQVIKTYVREENCPVCGGKSGRRNTDGTWKCQKCGNVWNKKLEIVEE